MQASPKVRWRCRRGIKEMDLILERFLDSGYAQLSAPERGEFERLLECPDQDIYAWLVGNERPPDAELDRLIGIVRAAVLG